MSSEVKLIDLRSAQAFHNRELSWLAFARRVIAFIESEDVPVLERVKFAGISGMLHDEFFMKRISGLKRQIDKGSSKLSLDGKTPLEEFQACRKELLEQTELVANAVQDHIRPALAAEGFPILDHKELDKKQRAFLRHYFLESVLPILTPLAVDSEHPFPFISNLGLNIAVLLPDEDEERFVRIKVPNNRPRWVPLEQGDGFVPLEQVIAANLDLMFPRESPLEVHVFRITRGAEGQRPETEDDDEQLRRPGSIVRQVSSELKARRFAGVVRLQVSASMPKDFRKWLSKQIGVNGADVYRTEGLIGLSHLSSFDLPERPDLSLPRHRPVTPGRLREMPPEQVSAIFEEIDRGDMLLHHPYESFDDSVLRFIESAAVDPQVLALKLTIYRTSSDSAIVEALAEAARRGKQVAVMVEITARFDEAPNIAWGKYLENEGVHVAYGVERLKTHVKLCLVVREEGHRIRRYAHVGTGNYHTGTARHYEDVGLLTADPEICQDVAMVFNSLTGATEHHPYHRLLVAPETMRDRFFELIERESEHARAGRPCGIHAKMNQLQDPDIIRALYRAGREGVPILLNVRGLCCLRAQVPGLSENIRVFSVVGRFLEHSRIYHFTNGGEGEYYIGSADWMKRNLSNRVETISPILDAHVRQQLDDLMQCYLDDNVSAWDAQADGTYVRRSVQPGEPEREVQRILIERARQSERSDRQPA